MNAQDRAVVKNLLQYMASHCLTSGDEFRETLKHFNITTVFRWVNERAERAHVVDVYAADMESGFERHTFKTKHAADVFTEVVCAAGDDE